MRQKNLQQQETNRAKRASTIRTHHRVPISKRKRLFYFQLNIDAFGHTRKVDLLYGRLIPGPCTSKKSP